VNPGDFMQFETLNDYYLAEADSYRDIYKHLDIRLTPAEAITKLKELGYQEDRFRGMLLGLYIPHELKALCCIALGQESKEMLHEDYPNKPRVDVILQTGNENDGWNMARVMFLMRYLF
jgi:hypothetical protein